MVLDLIWAAGEILCIAGLIYGAYLVLMETGPFLSLFGKRSAVPLFLSVEDLRLINGLAKSGFAGPPHSGNAVIDREHQGLSDDINRLRFAICSGQSVDEVDATIEAVIRDMVQHFQDEEAILTAAGYPGTGEHAALHRELVSGAAALARRFHAGMVGISKLFRFLVHDVVSRHTLDADQELISYFGSQH